MSSLRARLTFANVVSVLALFVALGGTATATILVTGKSVKDNSLTGADVKNNTLGSVDIKDGNLLAKDFKPGQLVRGPIGPQGPKGDAGESGLSTGAAGGDLSGNYPNPQIRAGAVTADRLAPAEAFKPLAYTDYAWSDYANGFNPFSYYKDPYGTVHLRGLLHHTNAFADAGAVTFAALPVGYRPANEELFAVLLSSGMGRLDVFNNGDVRVMQAVGADAWMSLDGIEFRAAG